MFDSVLVICVGNICRSPTGERLLQRELPEKKSILQVSARLLAMGQIAAQKRSQDLMD